MDIVEKVFFGFIIFGIVTLIHMNWQIVDLNQDVKSIKLYMAIDENIEGIYFDDVYCVSNEGLYFGVEEHERCHALIEDEYGHFCSDKAEV